MLLATPPMLIPREVGAGRGYTGLFLVPPQTHAAFVDSEYFI